MSILDPFIPTVELTEMEADIIQKTFANPTVRKYLSILGATASKELLSLPTLEETPESLMRKHTIVTGRLEVLLTLINIGVPKNELY